MRYSCSSTPLMPGIWTSEMRQDVSFNRGDDKNSFAEANAYAENPANLNNRAVALRPEASSSTIEITGTSSTRTGLARGRATEPRPDMWCRLIHDTTESTGGEVYLGFE